LGRVNGPFALGKALGSALLGLACLAPAPAYAADVVSAPMALVAAFGLQCNVPAVQPGWGDASLAPVSKANALLGGAPSELERIRMEQEGGAATLAQANAAQIPVELQSQAPLAPAGGPSLQPAACLQWLRPQAVPLAPARLPGASGDILASKRLAIGHTMFDADWARVNRDRISQFRSRQVLGTVPLAPESALERVNRWVNHNIAYVEDQQLFGRGDHWAGANRTLRLRKGDCEDIALTKMQLLAAAGIRREDMMLTIARDLVRNADHALLMVRLGDRYVMLDNATDAVLDASQANDYRPVLSFGQGRAWLHGYQTASAR
jgi:predicted transglutaminase-like cysteine proteinase